MQTLTLRCLFDDTSEELDLTWTGGQEHGAKTLNPDAYATHAVADMIGHLNLIHKDRIQVRQAGQRVRGKLHRLTFHEPDQGHA